MFAEAYIRADNQSRDAENLSCAGSSPVHTLKLDRFIWSSHFLSHNVFPWINHFGFPWCLTTFFFPLRSPIAKQAQRLRFIIDRNYT